MRYTTLGNSDLSVSRICLGCMPHTAITRIPGRDDAAKQALALKTRAFPAGESGLDPKFVSVPIQDVPKEDWTKSMRQFPDAILLVKPGA